jgi:outer membrane protein assembly factor BamB
VNRPGPRGWLALGCALLIVAAGLTVLLRHHDRAPACGAGESRVAAGDVPGIFLTGSALATQNDPRLARLVKAVAAMPFGRVVGAVGYDYGQWLTVSGLPGALGAWTKDNSVFGVLGPDLLPRWGIRQAQVQHAWDVAGDRFLELELAKHRSMEVSAYSLADGHRQWCASVGTVPTRYDDPLGTAVLPSGDVLVLADAPGAGGTLTRLGATTGKAGWASTVSGIDRGDFVGDLGRDVGVAGGQPAYLLTQGAAAPVGDSLIGFDEATGHRLWSYAPQGVAVHVVGADSAAGLVIVQQGSAAAGFGLVALDRNGQRVWASRPAGGAVADPALRADVIVVKTSRALLGVDARTGRRLWRTAYPGPGDSKQEQVFPYGFQIGAQPMLDADHMLLGSTAALRVLDLRTGTMVAYPLPTDGINTTFWPYQLAVTGDLIVMMTNIGAVAVEREVPQG